MPSNKTASAGGKRATSLRAVGLCEGFALEGLGLSLAARHPLGRTRA
jgi:hypothetical protein